MTVLSRHSSYLAIFYGIIGPIYSMSSAKFQEQGIGTYDRMFTTHPTSLLLEYGFYVLNSSTKQSVPLLPSAPVLHQRRFLYSLRFPFKTNLSLSLQDNKGYAVRISARLASIGLHCIECQSPQGTLHSFPETPD